MSPFKNIAIIGACGALGQAFLKRLLESYDTEHIYTFSSQEFSMRNDRVTSFTINYDDEDSIAKAANLAFKEKSLDLILVTSGILHDATVLPEKSLRDLSIYKFQKLFLANTIVPALVAKHFLPHLDKEKPFIFAALSARVGSISDNHLGGWYSYRASKTALNMVIKNIAIEQGRRNKQSIIVGLHPGTVNSKLSKPFSSNVPAHKLFTPEFSATKLLDVLSKLNPRNSGKIFAWDGSLVEP